MSLFNPNGAPYKQPPTPYGGMIDGVPAVTGPHLLVSGPTGVGKSRRVLGPGILMWEGPVVAVSSKPDLVDLCLQQRLAWGGHNRTYLLDLSGEVPDDVVPAGVHRVVVDPAVMAQTDDDALDLAAILMQSGAAGAGGGNGSGGGDAFWESVSTAPLAAILRAAPTMAWAMAAVSKLTLDEGEAVDAADKPDPLSLEGASWDSAIAILQKSGSELAGGLERAAQLTGTVGELLQENSDQFSPILAAELTSASLLDAKMRDSIAVTMKSAVSPWLRSTVRGWANEVAFVPDMLSHPASTLFIIAPATGVAAGAAVSCVDMVSKRWRANQTEKVRLPRLLLVVDELCNTMPWPKLPTVVTESRAMGLALLVAVQATSQLAKRYGVQGMEELRQVFPTTLLLVGAPERAMLENAAWWYGEQERERRSIDHQGHETRSTEMVPVKTAASLLPRSKNEGRLLRGSKPGDDPDVLNEAGLLVQLLDISQLRFDDGT